MAKKVIFADNILRAKGISKRNFDTSELNGLVEDFFMTHEANARFIIVSVRFADKEGMPDSGIENHLDSSFLRWNTRDLPPPKTSSSLKMISKTRTGIAIFR